jgi:hypothetical protein
LIWEVKTSTGPRHGDDTYTNLNNGLADDASGYAAAMNAANLCGFDDWRMPTVNELLSIVDHGRIPSVGHPAINDAWFPNTGSGRYWSAEELSTNSADAWYVSSLWSSSWRGPRSNDYLVRLVRGDPSGEPRYSYTTVAYDSDGTNNVVNDAWTGLQWRRCEQGRAWNGSACTGTAMTFTHLEALEHASDQTGWRLPNIKELSSLVDLSISSGARLQTTAFPGADAGYFWTTSPDVNYSKDVWLAHFEDGSVSANLRSNVLKVRLVRANQ